MRAPAGGERRRRQPVAVAANRLAIPQRDRRRGRSEAGASRLSKRPVGAERDEHTARRGRLLPSGRAGRGRFKVNGGGCGVGAGDDEAGCLECSHGAGPRKQLGERDSEAGIGNDDPDGDPEPPGFGARDVRLSPSRIRPQLPENRCNPRGEAPKTALERRACPVLRGNGSPTSDMTLPAGPCRCRIANRASGPAFVRLRRERQGGGAWRRPDSRPAGACS